MHAPIEDYALISDMQTAGLVRRNGSIDWLCFPRFDSGACFAELLGDERNGQWRAPPSGRICTRRRYVEGSLILESDGTRRPDRSGSPTSCPNAARRPTSCASSKDSPVGWRCAAS